MKDLSEQPYALICDLSGVDRLDPVCAAVFATVANHPSSRWPTTSFLLCGAQPPVAEILNRLQVPHFLALYPGVEEALDAAFARPPYLREELLLAPTLSAPASNSPAPGGCTATPVAARSSGAPSSCKRDWPALGSLLPGCRGTRYEPPRALP